MYGGMVARSHGGRVARSVFEKLLRARSGAWADRSWANTTDTTLLHDDQHIAYHNV